MGGAALRQLVYRVVKEMPKISTEGGKKNVNREPTRPWDFHLRNRLIYCGRFPAVGVLGALSCKTHHGQQGGHLICA
jgi:hypothetical protein